MIDPTRTAEECLLDMRSLYDRVKAGKFSRALVRDIYTLQTGLANLIEDIEQEVCSHDLDVR